MLGSLFVPDSPFSFGCSEDEEATLILFPDGAPWGVCEALFHHFPRPLRQGPTHAFPATTAIAAFHLFLHWLHSPPTVGLLSESESDSVLALRQVNTSLFSSRPASSVTLQLHSFCVRQCYESRRPHQFTRHPVTLAAPPLVLLEPLPQSEHLVNSWVRPVACHSLESRRMPTLYLSCMNNSSRPPSKRGPCPLIMCIWQS